ncbi:hypothetical protein HanRHA438_Chr16g0743471 [Helianthus annuus]|nr:hypothetical protein HanRHA438_Chr16g0743471 [Helianthus annuus]
MSKSNIDYLKSHHRHSLFSIKILNSKIFIPYKYEVIRCNNIRMQESFSIPPMNSTKSQRYHIPNNKYKLILFLYHFVCFGTLM